MALIKKKIPNLISGVSQQAQSVRLPSQAEVIENASLSPVEGLGKRRPTEYLSKVFTGSIGAVKTHIIEKSATEKYVLILKDNDLKLYNLSTGAEMDVAFPNGKGYLDVTDAKTDFDVISIADFTFIVNKTKETALSSTKSPSRNPEAIVFVREGEFGADYKIEINGTEEATYTTSTTDYLTLRTNNIASDLYNDLVANLGTTDWNFTRNGSVIWIDKKDGSDFDIKVIDSLGGNGIKLAKSKVQDFSSLPTVAPKDMIIEVAGDDKGNFDNYFVKFVLNNPDAIGAGANVVANGTFVSDLTSWSDQSSNGGDIVWKSSQRMKLTGTVEGVDFVYGPAIARQGPITVTTATDYELKLGYIGSSSSEYDARNVRWKVGSTAGGSEYGSGVFSQTAGTPAKFQFKTTGTSVYIEFQKDLNWWGVELDDIELYPTEVPIVFDAGIWEETVAPDIMYELDTTTMPVTLYKDEDGKWTMDEIQWNARTAGHPDSLPDPSFVGNTINQIFLHQNRVGFLAGETINLSRSGDFFNFFRETATTILDDDPIDIEAAHSQVSFLKRAVNFGNQLIVFSDRTQFSLTSNEDLLTPKSVSFTPVTEFLMDSGVEPVALGNNIYFAAQRGNYTIVREYYQQENGGLNGVDITANVPKYIPKNPYLSTGSNSENMLILNSSTNANELYIYKFLWDGQNKIQSAWNKWMIDSSASILGMEFIRSDLYLVIQYSDAVYLEKIDMSPGKFDPDSDVSAQVPYVTLLDRRIDESQAVSVVYNSGPDDTTITMPYSVTGTVEVVIRSDNPETLPHGQKLIVESASGTSVKVTGDHSSSVFYVGQQYTMKYEFSKPHMVATGDESGADVGGHLHIKTFGVEYDKTATFLMKSTPLLRDTSSYKFTGKVVGSGSNIIGDLPFESGLFRIPIMTRHDRVMVELENDSPFPAFFLSGVWEGQYRTRSQRV